MKQDHGHGSKHILLGQRQLILDVPNVWKEEPEEERKTWGKEERKKKENLTDIRNWTEMLTPNVILTDLNVILVCYHT